MVVFGVCEQGSEVREPYTTYPQGTIHIGVPKSTSKHGKKNITHQCRWEATKPMPFWGEGKKLRNP